ncbi:hypothetical protein PG996_012314 [Apiospora saccharicola]|uniref:Uncharacterized protein n=1 Tax=Apiospora saccharicola TaxID=335842 RepID=A0ABR1U4Y4_9PEZI
MRASWRPRPDRLVQLRYLSQRHNRDSLCKTLAEASDFATMYFAYGDVIDASVAANEKMPNTLRALTNRMICAEIMSRLPDLKALHRVIQVNSFFYDVFKNDEERIKLKIVIDHMDLEAFRLAKYDKQVRYLAKRYLATEPPQPAWR